MARLICRQAAQWEALLGLPSPHGGPRPPVAPAPGPAAAPAPGPPDSCCHRCRRWRRGCTACGGRWVGCVPWDTPEVVTASASSLLRAPCVQGEGDALTREALGERPGGQQVEVVPEVSAAAVPLTAEEQEQLQRELGWGKGLDAQGEDEGALEDEALGAAAEGDVGSLEALLAELDADEKAAVVDEGAGGLCDLRAGLAAGAAGPGTGGSMGEQTLVRSGELTLVRSGDSWEGPEAGAVQLGGGLAREQEQEEDEEEGGNIEGLWDGVDETVVAISVAAAAAAAEAEAALMAQHDAQAAPAG